MRIVNQILGMQKIYGFQILFCRFIALSSTNSEQSPLLFTPMTFILRVDGSMIHVNVIVRYMNNVAKNFKKRPNHQLIMYIV